MEQGHLVGQPQVEELVDGVEDVGTPVAEGSHAEVIPATPFALMVEAVVVVPLLRAEPCVPIHALRQRLCFGELMDVGVEFVPTARVVHVGGDGGDILDDACLLPGLELEIVGFGVALVSDLCGKVRMTAGILHQQLRLHEGACHGLLYVDVLAFVEGHHTNGEVDMVRNSCQDGIELRTGLLEHLTEVVEAFGLRVFFQYFLHMLAFKVDVAKCNDLDEARLFELLNVEGTLVADADIGNLHFVGLHASPFLRGHRTGKCTRHIANGQTCRGQAHLF